VLRDEADVVKASYSGRTSAAVTGLRLDPCHLLDASGIAFGIKTSIQLQV